MPQAGAGGSGVLPDQTVWARLLLAELCLDIIAEELSHRYVDRTTKKGDRDSYRQVKLDLIRRFGVEIHQVLLGE